MTTIKLNIGLETNQGKNLETFFTKDLVEFSIKNGFAVIDYKSELKFSDTEQTLIIEFKSSSAPKHIEPRIKFLANALSQDCIAVKFNDNGKLIYSDQPLNDWGSFNQDYFLEL